MDNHQWNQSVLSDLPDQAIDEWDASKDSLGVLGTTRPIVAVSQLAWINHDGLAIVAKQLRAFKQQEEGQGNQAGASSIPWNAQYHFFDGTPRTVNWLLLLDALNFCFWAEKGQDRWQVEYGGQTLGGYWAEAAALTRAVEEGYLLWDAQYLSELSSTDLAHMLRGISSIDGQTLTVIPLFEQRLAHAREVGRVLLERYDGQFIHTLEEAAGSAVRLAQLLVEHFPSFRDCATYRGREVRFLKRAQICAADVHSAFGGKQWGAFHDLDRLTIFADYKLPQILRHFGVLEYHPSLARRVDDLELLAAGSEEEIEIRAATIWACELLRQSMAAQQPISAAEIDARLWLLSQNLTGMRPYHRVRTMYY
jgi:hypothetical protein